ncbi:Xaa-Pro peptidase family protein [Pseudomonas paraeruginosa]|uniref:M24 family metallopeptidase n=1 Tax=Pseudomonas aeruginosa group TaxID=136841 RepID=UPI00053EE2AA|nr:MULTISPECIES: Xaa-Pro peptidase family protein [Pseudomonas aeruginosa group]KAB0752307.1 aminopeptidase P family protein [Pseudomonas aeruginosa]MBG4066623.1 aminopeptidase P family protein [Pseudomonas aeruginosa]MBG5601742.1 aminopeptidase P family protein [Pseudomonas aeruginosa]MBH3672738.1 aminopeptidase P family protein [Pseudomonas aeruginosa]MBH9431955.1 aminopeptidase P family protein [Pseudomonas aeruginosa]
MTVGVGGSTPEQALARLRNMTDGAQPIGLPAYRQRIAAAQAWMRERGIAAAYLHAGSNLRYFSGVQWHPSERLVGALLPAEGALEYLAPTFEEGTVRDFQVVDGIIHTWEEHQDPYRLLLERLAALGIDEARPVALCPTLPFEMFDRLRRLAPARSFVSAAALVDQGRMHKSAEELALMQRAKNMTLEVQKAAASILREGISTTEVAEFIHQAHRKVGAPGSTFCIVLFGAASAFPHGVKHAQVLKGGDMVLIDTGCQLHGYQSDITRSYVFGMPSTRQREFWAMERDAQLAAFDAARLGQPCEAVDAAARRSLEANGLGPDYRLPGLPHRTGHGIGLDVHEGPYLVRGDRTPLDVGMCFSNEPMICVPGEFGIRLEDHFYMTAQGPCWFTQPSPSIDDPFGLQG